LFALALASFEFGVGFADDIEFAPPSDDFAVFVTGFGGFEGGKDFHDDDRVVFDSGFSIIP
jgi:hypothetical protein